MAWTPESSAYVAIVRMLRPVQAFDLISPQNLRLPVPLPLPHAKLFPAAPTNLPGTELRGPGEEGKLPRPGPSWSLHWSFVILVKICRKCRGGTVVPM